MIRYEINRAITVDDYIRALQESTLAARRPIADRERMDRIWSNSNITAIARDGERIAGIARGLTDFAYVCYIADLAVPVDYQRRGIGKELIARLQAHLGEEVMILLLAAPAAAEYYPHIGFAKVENAWCLPRRR